MPLPVSVIDFTPVETGDLSEIPPDMPEGDWEGHCIITCGKTEKDGYPMFRFEWHGDEPLTEGNEVYVGAKASEWIIFPPETLSWSRMQKQRIKALCEGLDIALPDTSTFKDGSFESAGPFIEQVEGQRWRFTTKHEKDKKDGSTRVAFKFHGIQADSSDREEDAPRAAAASKAKSNGKPAVNGKAKKR